MDAEVGAPDDQGGPDGVQEAGEVEVGDGQAKQGRAPEPHQQAQEVIRLEREFWEGDHQPGTVCYAIDGDWWRGWCAYTGFSKQAGQQPSVDESPENRGPAPGSIDNNNLVDKFDSFQIIDSSKEGQEFTIKSAATWALFCELYPGSGPEIVLPVTREGKITQLRRYYMHRSSDLGAQPHKICLSSLSTVGALKKLACQAYGIEESETQIYDYFNKKKSELLDAKLDSSVETAVLVNNQDMLIQEKVDGKFPAEEKEAASSSDTYLPSFPGINRLPYGGSATDGVIQREGAKPGTAGLGNLGNTCFLNSSVQCLAHSIPLMRTFLSDAYKADVNRDNPLGNGGKLAEAFGELMKKLWQADTGSVTPRHFKQQVASFNSSFAGYSQHDSQELLAFLLDGLHEDLNRVRQKPYIEIPDSNGRPDEELAEEAWRIYKARNNSFIADHFQGMYKSTLVCPECSYSSVTMETFNCLSLPLPSAKMQDVEVTVVSMDGSAPPTHYTAQVLRLGTISDLYASIAKLCGVDPGQAEKLLLLVETSDGRIKQKFSDLKEPLADAIRPGSSPTLLAYKYSSADWGPGSGGKEMHVFQRRKRKRRTLYFGSDKELFAAPLLLWLPEAKLRAPDDSSAIPLESLLEPDGLVSIAVETALRPFKRKKDAAANECSTFEQSTVDSLPVHDVGSFATLPESDSDAPFGMEPDRVLGGNDLYSIALDSTSPPETPKGQSSPTTSPLGSPRANSFTSDSSQTSPHKPFNMFALQQPDEPDLLEQREVDADQPAYSISPTNFHGSSSLRTAMLDDNELYFAIDWEASAALEYDPECMDVPQLHSSTEEARARHKEGPKPFTLQECLEAFLEGERLEDSESWCCKQCKKRVQAHKKLDLWDLPEVAVIHLKRFSYSNRFRDKIDRLVKFPLGGLDLQSATLKQQEVEPVYDLFAVSNHFGGMGGGHYTAYAKLNESDKWYCFDDSNTYPVQAKDVVTSAAYVLFYRRRQETLQDRGKTSAELIESSKSESEWSDVATMEEEPEKVENLRAQVALPAIDAHLSEIDVDEPMQSLPSSPHSRKLLNSLASGPPEPGVQEAPADGLLSNQEAMKFCSTAY